MPDRQNAHPVHAVLFDYGLVLSGPPDPVAWKQMKDLLGASEDALHEAYWAPRHDYDRGALTGDAYWHLVAKTLGRNLKSEEHAALIEADNALWTQPNQPMIDWAAQLQAAGIRTGILSNLGDAMEVGILARFAWLADFAHHTFSHRLGIAKPEPAIYAHAAEGLGTAPENVLFLDDREENIRAAHAAGMQAIMYTSHDAFLRAMHEAGLQALLTPATKG